MAGTTTTTHIALETSVPEDNNVQYMPCSIDYDGRAKVSAYFKEKSVSDGGKRAVYSSLALGTNVFFMFVRMPPLQ